MTPSQIQQVFFFEARHGHCDALRYLLPKCPDIVHKALHLAKSNKHRVWNIPQEARNEVIDLLSSETTLRDGDIEHGDQLLGLARALSCDDAALVAYSYISSSCVPTVERAHQQRLRAFLRNYHINESA